MTVLSRGARVRRGGRRPGWVLLTALLVLAMGASSALVFTNRVELLKLAVILALWAAVAGAFVSVLYRRQSDADQSRVRDLKLVYDLQLDREISARREYELTVESQLRRELASELRAEAADDLAELRAELSALRTSLEILFDTDLAHRPALETPETEAPPERAYSEWDRNGETPRDAPYDWVASDRVTSVPQDNPPSRADDTAIIDVPEEPLLPPRQPSPRRERVRHQYESPHEPVPPAQPEPSYSAAPPEPEPEPQPQVQGWQPDGCVRTVAAARNAGQPLGRLRSVRPAGRRYVGPSATRPPLRTRGGLGRPARRAGVPAAVRRVGPPGAVAPLGGVPRLRRAQLRAHERANVRSAAPRSRRGHAPATAAITVATPRRRATPAAAGPAATAGARAAARRRGPAG